MMTFDELFAHIQSNGFNGVVPGKADVMADSWARHICELFDRTAQGENVPKTEERHTAWVIWQWLYCELTGVRSRVIASPEAMRAAGVKVNEAIVDLACRLLLASQKY